MSSKIDQAKREAAKRAVDEHLKDNSNVGIGSGSTVVFVVERIKQRVQEEKLNITCFPTSFQAKQLIVDGGLTLGNLESAPSLDVVFDGADEVDEKLALIKGGGAAHMQEKLVASW